MERNVLEISGCGDYTAVAAHRTEDRVWIWDPFMLREREVQADLWWWMGSKLPIFYRCSWQKLAKDRWDRMTCPWNCAQCMLAVLYSHFWWWCHNLPWLDFQDFFSFLFCLNMNKSTFDWSLSKYHLKFSGTYSWIKPGTLGLEKWLSG